MTASITSYASRTAQISPGFAVRRALPNRDHRMVGPWCFIDEMGPADTALAADVGPHPHIGLQTLTWLWQGALHHGDSVGSSQIIRPGAVNLMTAGSGVVHWELQTDEHAPVIHGAQLWIALPHALRGQPPAFEHHASLPQRNCGDVLVTVLIGALAGATSPATAHSPIVGAALTLDAAGAGTVTLDPTFEHALVVAEGTVEANGEALSGGHLHVLADGTASLTLTSPGPAKLLLLGGAPFGESILMWWNFVARTHDEIAAATERWTSGDRFGDATTYPEGLVPAPPVPNMPLKARSPRRS